MSSLLEREPLVTVQDVVKVFRLRSKRGRKRIDVPAVNGVSFELRAGESLGIVGESGAGKSTMARILVGLEPPTSGRVSLAGREVSALPSRAERMARGRVVQMVFQDPYTSLDPRQSVSSALNEVQRVHFHRTRSARAHRTHQLLDAVGLGSREANAYPRGLSGGQRQRVAIACALAAEPQLLVLDEAVSALDVSVQAQILNLLTRLRRELGLAYIVISHDLAVARQLCDEVLVMYRGEVVERGPIQAVLAAPRDEYTRGLLASIPDRSLLDNSAKPLTTGQPT
jgi:peptide/nickel transport system ATP-binding protein